MNTDASHLLLLLNWMSPSFPIGAYAYSHGLEYAIAAGDIATPAQVESWITDIITQGSGWNDAVLFSHCWSSEITKLNELALALSPSRERHLETTQLGRAFLTAAAVFTNIGATHGEWAYPVAAGHSCRTAGIAADQALLAYLQGFCASLVSVAVRLVPIGQLAGLQILRNLVPVIAATATRAQTATLADLGSNTLLADIASMRHESLETRIFRT
jgi:urease accessory protein